MIEQSGQAIWSSLSGSRGFHITDSVFPGGVNRSGLNSLFSSVS